MKAEGLSVRGAAEPLLPKGSDPIPLLTLPFLLAGLGLPPLALTLETSGVGVVSPRLIAGTDEVGAMPPEFRGPPGEMLGPARGLRATMEAFGRRIGNEPVGVAETLAGLDARGLAATGAVVVAEPGLVVTP